MCVCALGDGREATARPTAVTDFIRRHSHSLITVHVVWTDQIDTTLDYLENLELP